MQVNQLNNAEATWLEKVRFAIAFSHDTSDYGVFLRHLLVLKRNFPDPRFVAGIALVEDQLTLYLNFTVLMKLPMDAAIQIVIHEVLHPICGHTGSRGDALRERCGTSIFGIAVDLVVNQFIDIQPLIMADLKPVTLDMTVKLKHGTYKLRDLGFLENQTSEQYADQLLKLDWEEPPEDPRFEQFDESMRSALADTITQSVIEGVREQMTDKLNLNRGFNSNDAQSFIAQKQGPPVISWNMRLKRLYTGCLNSRRVATPLRPSRRCEWHQGRITRQDMYIWFAIDTSGSMGPKQLSLIEKELKGLRKLDARIRILHCDAEIAKEFDYNGGTIGDFFGRGGTDFSPIFNKLHDTPRYNRPNLLVFFTDGFGGYEQYASRMESELGWYSFLQRKAPTTFERVPLLWLVPESSHITELSRFAEFGELAIVPVEEEHVRS